MSRRSRGGRRRLLTTLEERERFFAREARDAETWHKLTERQRRQPKWQPREAQQQHAGALGLILLIAGEDLPEPLRRALRLSEPPVIGAPSGLQLPAVDPDRTVAALCREGLFAPGGRLGGLGLRAIGRTPWGSPWPRPG
jgi:hypothetical protein